MSTDNNTGVQTRAMAETQCIEGEANWELTNNPEQTRDAQNPNMNPTVDLHKTDDIIIEEFVKRQGTMGLDWYVPDLCNTRVGILIKNRLPIYATQGRIIFNCPPLSEFFSTSNFELDLTTGQVYTFLTPPEDIGVPCQQEEFDLELLAEKLQKDPATSELRMEELELERIPLIRKIAVPADTMDLEEVEGKIRQYLQLWKLYTEISVELKRKSELSRESAVTACKVYGSYISDILQQVDEVMKLFAMEKELGIIKNRGHFPIPTITPQATKIETAQDRDKALEEVDMEVTEMIKAFRRSEASIPSC